MLPFTITRSQSAATIVNLYGITSAHNLSLHPSQIKQLHALLLTTGLSRKNSLLTNLLLSLPATGGAAMAHARAMFDDMHKPRVFLWNTLIRAYVNHGLAGDATSLYRRMHSLGVRPDSVTYPFVLKACAALVDVWMGLAAHAVLAKLGLEFDVIARTELMVMHAKFGDSDSADYIFERMDESRDLVCWNALISVYAQSGRADKALALFRRMGLAGVEPDAVTLACAISACAYLGCLELGKRLHSQTSALMPRANVIVHNALLDMYSKCGSMEEAAGLFDQMPERTVVSWSTMISGYAMNGESRRALDVFSQMRSEGVRPNHVTMLAVLSACSHAGLVSEGKEYFYGMPEPRIEHYASMVDLLGRSGHLEEAYKFIENMPVEPDAGVWGALLGACTVRCNIELGQIAADQLLKLAPKTLSYHVLLSNIYAVSQRWDDVEKVRENMRVINVKKVPAYSSVELDGKFHVFYERSHARRTEIYNKLDDLMTMVRSMGYTPDTAMALHDIEREEREAVLRTHSEKLAIAFSLIYTKPGTPLRVIKNLRVCSDCHLFTKFVSKATDREIIMRDKSRFHHFKDGECSCRDFW